MIKNEQVEIAVSMEEREWGDHEELKDKCNGRCNGEYDSEMNGNEGELEKESEILLEGKIDEKEESDRCVEVLEKSMTTRLFTIKEHVNPHNEVVKLTSILLLILMLISGACKGPLTISLPPENLLVKLVWRTQGGFLISIIISAFMYIQNSATMSFSNDTRLEYLIDSAIRSFLGFIWATGLILGCSMTVTSHAQITNNATGVYIIIFSAFTCAKLSKYDLIGHGLWIIGAAIAILDPHAIKIGAENPSIIGALIPLIGALFGSFLTFIDHKKKSLHPIITMTQFYFFSVIYQLTLFPLLTKYSGFYSFDQTHGAFGWLANMKNLLLVICIISPLTGVLEKVSYLFANRYFSLQKISVLIVFEPYIGQVFGVLLRQDNIPGAMTWIGMLITSVGFLIASYGERLKHKEDIRRIIEESLLSEGDEANFSYQEMEDRASDK